MWIELGGAGADDVHAQQRVRLRVEDELQESHVVAQQVAAGRFAVAGRAGLIRHALLGQLLFAAPHGADLGDGIDAEREFAAAVADGMPEHVADRGTALVHRGRSQTGEPDDVAYGVDGGVAGGVVLVGGQAAAFVGLEAGRLQVQARGGGLAAQAPQHRFRGQHLAAQQRHFDAGPGIAVAIQRAHAGNFLAQAQRQPAGTQVVLQRLADLRVQEIQDARAALNSR